MYQIIGPDYRWGGRNDWSKENWTAFVSKPSLETWLAYQDGNPVGYYEMELMKDRTIKIHCVGLIKKYIGLGLGAHLLSHCVDRGWQHNPTKITLNTCSHDHPRALPNYLKEDSGWNTTPSNRKIQLGNLKYSSDEQMLFRQDCQCDKHI